MTPSGETALTVAGQIGAIARLAIIDILRAAGNSCAFEIQ